MNSFRKTGKRKILLACVAVIALSACEATTRGGTTPQSEARAVRVEEALQRAVAEGAQKGKSTATLAVLEREYKNDSDDEKTALSYARALREADYLNRALMVLAPFAGEEEAPSTVLSEYSMIVLAMGRYDESEEYARKAILKYHKNFQAYHALGIALDAQGHHKQAEVSFRKGLDNWQGDPVPILNNLALNLAEQGLLDEAVSILHRAADAAPGRPEVERNLRIVSALQETQNYTRHSRNVADEVETEDKLITPERKPGNAD